MRTREACAALDAADPLKSRRALFALPKGDIYLDGNSLGPPPLSALKRLDAAAREEWGQASSGRGMRPAGWICRSRSAPASPA